MHSSKKQVILKVTKCPLLMIPKKEKKTKRTKSKSKSTLSNNWTAKTQKKNPYQNDNEHESETIIYKCEDCDKRYKSKDSLFKYRNIHLKRFEYDICQKYFQRNAALTVHKRIHTNERPFECNVCNKKFGH